MYYCTFGLTCNPQIFQTELSAITEENKYHTCARSKIIKVAAKPLSFAFHPTRVNDVVPNALAT